MAHADWEQFRAAVLADRDLQQRLRSAPDWQTFVELTLRLSAERGYGLTTTDLERALQESHRMWLERWL
ncbi:MAG TPA: hypothetical protein VFS21_06465 [Roseiflexaceae bacterium]|nr:hypothetical protein [Roseiflexaceae bacterium]